MSTLKLGEPVREQKSLPASTPFLNFAQTCSRIGGERGKLEKIRVLAQYLLGLPAIESALAATWLTGHPFSSSQNRVLQLGWAVLRDALCTVAKVTEAKFHEVYLKHSDLGDTAAELLEGHTVEAGLTLAEVDALFHRLHTARGPVAKTPLLTAVLRRCSPLEARFLVKVLTGDLRIGLKEGLVEDAIASAFDHPPEHIRQANLLLGDVGLTSRLAAEGRLSEATLVPFRPIKFMLASPEETAATVWERRSGSPALWLEDKYDGVRCQLHKAGPRIALFSRDLKEITATFLELTDAARQLTSEVVLDGEIVAMRGEEALPFAELQKRLGRRGDDLFLRHEVPVQFVIFDLLWQEGRVLLDQALRERRRLLESLRPWPAGFRLARVTEADSVAAIEAAFNAARGRGNEGLMIKDPDSPYSPGRRGLAWLKLKKPMATLDCVVVGVEYGHGKRNKVLSDYTFAVRDALSGELKVIGKAYSGLTDAEIVERTEHFLKIAVHKHGRFIEVQPETVVEIAFDKIAPSNRHGSGLALRFPRIVRIRRDKSVADIDTLQTARRLAGVE